ncbi:MAG: DUF6600 domain-containing protein [Chitinophagaceae bacterium]
MKNILKFSVISLASIALLSGCASYQGMASPNAVYQDGGPHISFDVFYNTLSPYGQWINYANYGQVWIPSVGYGFSPYSTNGHWVYTNYGWTWLSDYSWGWAPFHYGRWLYDDYYGWIWVPGSDWAPAWVAWRNSPDYYGWAPLGPGININISIGIPAASWCFVPRHYFGSPYGYRYYVPRTRNVTIINNTTIINNVNVYNNNRYYSGPSRSDVQYATNRDIRPVRVFSSSNAGVSRVNNNRLSIYRPTVERMASNDSRIRETSPNGNNYSPASVHGNNRPERVFNPQQQSGNRNPGFQNGFPSDNTRPARNMQPNINQRVRENNSVQQGNNNRPERVFNPNEISNNPRQPQGIIQQNQAAREVQIQNNERRAMEQNQQRMESRPQRTFNPGNIRIQRSENIQRPREESAPSNNRRQVEVKENDRGNGNSHPNRRW